MPIDSSSFLLRPIGTVRSTLVDRAEAPSISSRSFQVPRDSAIKGRHCPAPFRILLAMEGESKRPDEAWSWETDILAQYPSGVDSTQIEERLKLTPTERLERMRQFLLFLEGAKRGRGN
ncbi:MAG: hypothetical protein ACJ75H_21320 [Thermoanaerobaculia bacterium]